MNAFEFPFALLAFLGFVMVVPAWMYFTFQHPALDSLSIEAQFIAQMVPPATVAIALASWLEPG